MALDWATPPTVDEFLDAAKTKRYFMEELAVAKLDLKILQAEIKFATKSTAAIIIGRNEEERERLVTLMNRIIELDGQLEAAKDSIEHLKRRTDMYRAWAFSNR